MLKTLLIASIAIALFNDPHYLDYIGGARDYILSALISLAIMPWIKSQFE